MRPGNKKKKKKKKKTWTRNCTLNCHFKGMHFCFVWFSRHQWLPAAAAQSFMNKKKLWFCSCSCSSAFALWCELCLLCFLCFQRTKKAENTRSWAAAWWWPWTFSLEELLCNISHARLAELQDQSVCFHRYVCVYVCVCVCVFVFFIQTVV
jgi:hypothetical protein